MTTHKGGGLNHLSYEERLERAGTIQAGAVEAQEDPTVVYKYVMGRSKED